MQLGPHKTKEQREKASCLHGTDRKEQGILNLWSSLLSANIFKTHWSHVSLKSFLVPRKHVHAVLDSWSDNLANGVVGLMVLTLLRSYLGTDIMSDKKIFPQRNLGNGT